MIAELRTDRLLLRPRTTADMENCLAMDRDPEVTNYIDGPWDNPEQHRTFLEQRMSHAHIYPLGYWAVTTIDHPTEFLGWVMAVGTDKPTQVELGWRLIQKSWGKGYAREAVCKVIDHVVRHLPETQFIASIHPENLGSIKVAKIAGMRLNQETTTDASFEKIFTLTKTQFFSREKLKS